MLRIKHPFLATLLAGAIFAMTLSPAAHAETLEANKPSVLAVFADILIRPVLIAETGVGLALFTVTLPFSALGGNVDDMAEVLVKEPATSAFLRCLGCTKAQDRSRRVSQQIDEASDNETKK